MPFHSLLSVPIMHCSGCFLFPQSFKFFLNGAIYHNPGARPNVLKLFALLLQRCSSRSSADFSSVRSRVDAVVNLVLLHVACVLKMTFKCFRVAPFPSFAKSGPVKCTSTVYSYPLSIDTFRKIVFSSGYYGTDATLERRKVWMILQTWL